MKLLGGQADADRMADYRLSAHHCRMPLVGFAAAYRQAAGFLWMIYRQTAGFLWMIYRQTAESLWMALVETPVLPVVHHLAAAGFLWMVLAETPVSQRLAATEFLWTVLAEMRVFRLVLRWPAMKSRSMVLVETPVLPVVRHSAAAGFLWMALAKMHFFLLQQAAALREAWHSVAFSRLSSLLYWMRLMILTARES